jgi:3D-(3,5/4)-trihydroxycyclohexane-1,2-dione acylhydrolase (decyclizing)
LIASLKQQWEAEVDRLFHLGLQPKPAQSEVIGAMWEASGPRDILLSAAGSHPGDLHKLWRTRTPNGYHMEYGYSCMGYEIPGAIGAKLADPSREVYVFLGDGTYLMMPGEIVTAVQEGVKIIIVLVDNHGFASIGGLSQSLGQQGFGTAYRTRAAETGQLEGNLLPVDYEANARSLGACAMRVNGIAELRQALENAKAADRTSVIVIETEREVRVPGYESWWDVAVAEVSEMAGVRESRARYVEARRKERHHL